LEKPSIVLDKVTVAYPNTPPVFNSLSLKLEGPGLIQVLGPNGSGKSTLLKTMLGLLKPLEGRVFMEGVDVTGNPSKAGRLAGYVPQLEPTEKHYPLTLWELIETECLLRCKPWPRTSSSYVKRRVERALEAVRIPRSLWHRRLNELSGGQLQRGLIARSFIHDPRILLMDEPLSSVDPAGKTELSQLIGKLSTSKLVIVTSHDPMMLLEYTRQVILISHGTITVGRPEEVFKPEILGKVYGESIIYVEKHYHIPDEHYTIARNPP